MRCCWHLLRRGSHPARVRGLKLDDRGEGVILPRSHPARVRGLKHAHINGIDSALCVAPRAGAWIETLTVQTLSGTVTVAPRAGAWIETSGHAIVSKERKVAPRAGAWIETRMCWTGPASCTTSHPARVRGLKRLWMLFLLWFIQSHPARVRGLKPCTTSARCCTSCVAPRAGAWIETIHRHCTTARRGGRTPRGCVD